MSLGAREGPPDPRGHMSEASVLVRVAYGSIIGLASLLVGQQASSQEPTAKDPKGVQDAAPGAVKIDDSIPAYKPVQAVSGSLKSIGSDTMNNEMANWAEGFRKFYPSVKIEIEGKGSGSAPPALEQGTADFGPMSREMKKDEMDKFEKKYGYKPTSVKTSLDVLALYVHKDNPLKTLTLQQVDAIFSKNRRG